MLDLPNPSRWERESKSYLGSGVLCCSSCLAIIEQHWLWGCSLGCGVLLGFGVDSEMEALGWILQFADSFQHPLQALSALETCRALFKGVSYFRVEGGEGEP